MPPVGRFADIAKQRLVAKRRQLEAQTMGVELPPEPEPERESDIPIEVEKYLSQMMAFVGQDGYGPAKKSVFEEVISPWVPCPTDVRLPWGRCSVGCRCSFGRHTQWLCRSWAAYLR